MKFPTSQAAVAKLADSMFKGYYKHVADFPNVSRLNLLLAIKIFQEAVNNQLETVSAFRIASENKNEKLKSLVSVMKKCIKKSIVDTKANPEKLKLIGWGPRTEPQPAQLPTQPLNLQLIAKENKIVKLKWDRPAGNLPVRNYVIECRKQTSEGLSDWTIVQISYNTEVTLRNQPMGIQLEYRIRAANNAGTSPPSNTVSIIL